MYYYIFIILIAQSVGDFLTDLKYIKSCNESSPITLEMLNNVIMQQKLDQESSNFKCFLHCLFTKYNWMDEDGGFLIHHIKVALEEVQIEASNLKYILFKCTAVSDIDKCERAIIFTQCFWEKSVQKQDADDHLLYHILDD